jgi:hypothetical protein
VRRSLPTLTLLLLFGLVSFSVHGQERWKIQRIRSSINFDGIPDEAVWDSIEPFPLVTYLPVSGRAPSEKSLIKMAYDHQYLYVAGLLYVSSPDYIQAIGKKRDMFGASTDWLGINLDTYNDKENALFFYTNPNGLRLDGTVFNDATPSGEDPPVDFNWNTFWDVKVSMDEAGWYSEVRIPISSLRFETAEEKSIMGLGIIRWIPAKNEMEIFPEIPQLWGEYSNMKPSRYAEVEFEGMVPKKPLYISPYLLSGYEQAHELNGDETAYDYTGNVVLEPGLDIKYGINPNTTLDLTVNTDFAQVEADQQQFNLSRFSLLFPEKRPFFLERSSIFNFDVGGGSSLFYSRRIGLYDGNPVRIWGGARVISRVNDWDIGFLDMQTASFEDLPSENFGVLRLKKRVFNPYSYAGGMITSRIGADGSYNIAYGLDGVIRLFGDDYLTLRWAQSFMDTTRNNPFSLDPSRFLVTWERRKQEGFSYMFAGGYHGVDYEPGIGLERFVDYWVLREDMKYTWISPDSSKMHNHSILLQNYNINSVVDNTLLIYRFVPSWTFVTKTGWGGQVSLIYNREFLEEDFEILDPVVVPTGRYQYVNTEWMFYPPQSWPLSTMLMFQGGGYYDGIRFSPSIKPTWNIGASVELGGFYQFDYVDFAARDQVLKNHIAGLQLLYMLSTKTSFSGYVQYNTAIHKVISNFRFRYNPKEGTDLYLVYNEGRNSLPDREIPTLPPYDSRNIMVKFTYTFEL